MPGGMAKPGEPAPEANVDPSAPKTPKVNTNEITNLSLTFRAVSINNPPDANSKLLDVVEAELKASPYFVPEELKFEGKITPDETNLTYTFGVNLKLKRPFKLL